MDVLTWLLDSDPAIRWQTMRDLNGAPADEVASERSKVASVGWGARLLALQAGDGFWGSGSSNPEWVTFEALQLLRGMGLDPASNEARRAVALVRENVTWQGVLPQDAAWHGNAFFTGEVEPCINGRLVAVGAYFGEDVRAVVDRLLLEQMADGGWNCEQVGGSTRGSFHTTICVLEGLLAYQRARGETPELRLALERGHAYLLNRRMLRRLSTGEVVDADFAAFSYPTGYHYDVLRGLDHLRAARVEPDERVVEAIALVESKRDVTGRWFLENPHPDRPDFGIEEIAGRPSRWNTLRALRVLQWHGEDGHS